MGPVMIFGAAILVLYPLQRRKTALFWIAIGLFQVIFSGFYSFPYGVFVTFPNEVAFGLFVLTCGIVLAIFDAVKTQRRKRVLSLFCLILGFLELLPFVDFSVKNPDFAIWNVWVNATPYLAFLASGTITIICGVAGLFFGKRN